MTNFQQAWSLFFCLPSGTTAPRLLPLFHVPEFRSSTWRKLSSPLLVPRCPPSSRPLPAGLARGLQGECVSLLPHLGGRSPTQSPWSSDCPTCPPGRALAVLGLPLLPGPGGHESEEEPRSQSSKVNSQGRHQVSQHHILLLLPQSSQDVLGHLHRTSALGRGLIHH